MKHALLAAALVMIGWSNVRAAVPMRIETATDGDQTRLLIPRQLLAGWQTALRGQDAHTPQPGLASHRFAAPFTGPLSLTVIALSLAAAFSLAGFCFLRKPGPLVRGGLAVLVLLLLAPGVINVAHAVGVGRFQTRPNHPDPDFQLSGPIVVEIVESGDAVRLILSKKSPLNLKDK